MKNKQKITIKERGPILPLGIQDRSGALIRDISIKPWRMKEEKELGELRDKNKDSNLAAYVSMILSTMCTKLGPYNFEEMKLEEKNAVISQMFMGDVFYVYVWLRINCLGSKFPVEFKPNWSNKDIKIKADLNSIEVNSVENFEEACWNYKLKNPIEIRGKLIKSFKMGPLRWASLEFQDNFGANNQGLAKLLAIKASIIKCTELESEVMLIDKELDELTKYDIENLTSLIDKKSIGLVMAIEGNHNGRDYQIPIDWSYDNFFTISSD